MSRQCCKSIAVLLLLLLPQIWLLCRRADKAVTGSSRSRVRGAKAFASSRTRTQATWGRQYAAEADEENDSFLKTMGNANTHGTFNQRSKDAYGDFLKVRLCVLVHTVKEGKIARTARM